METCAETGKHGFLQSRELGWRMLGRAEQQSDAVAGARVEAGTNKPPVARLFRGREVPPADEKDAGSADPGYSTTALPPSVPASLFFENRAVKYSRRKSGSSVSVCNMRN
jgi:hypothetical protein